MGNDATPLLAFLIIVLVCGSFMSMIVNYIEYSPATDEANNVVVYGAFCDSGIAIVQTAAAGHRFVIVD